LEADNYVLNIIFEGYKIPVHPGTEEIAYNERNNCSARMEEEFVMSEVERLVKAGLVVPSVDAPLCVNPLSVAFKQTVDGLYKRRFGFIETHKSIGFSDSYRVTTLGDTLAQTLPGDFQFVFDLEAAYHHVRVHPELYKYLGFCLDFDGKE
jgi:hypothetical protein